MTNICSSSEGLPLAENCRQCRNRVNMGDCGRNSSHFIDYDRRQLSSSGSMGYEDSGGALVRPADSRDGERIRESSNPRGRHLSLDGA